MVRPCRAAVVTRKGFLYEKMTKLPNRRQPFYRQCYLRRIAPGGQVCHTIGFIPERFAVSGKVLRLTLGDREQAGWEVISAGSQRFPEYLLVHQSQDYKRMRKASDI